MNRRTAELLATEYVDMKVASELASQLQQVKYEETINTVYGHYILRVKVLFLGLVLALSFLSFQIFLC